MPTNNIIKINKVFVYEKKTVKKKTDVSIKNQWKTTL